MIAIPILILLVSLYIYAYFRHTNEQDFGKHPVNQILCVSFLIPRS